MIDTVSLGRLRSEVDQCVDQNKGLLQQLRETVRPLKQDVRRIHPYTTSALSLVATDGGNNQVRFDPLLVQLIRVVDSNNAEYCLEAVTPRTSPAELVTRHLGKDGNPKSAFGRMMSRLGARTLFELSIIAEPGEGEELSPSWVQVYRDLMEWAVLLELIAERDFPSDILVIRDGLLRSKLFAKGKFGVLARQLEQAIEEKYRGSRRRVYLAGVAKRSKVLQTYQLAMALEGVLRTAYPCYVEVPIKLQESVYRWAEWARGGGEGEAMVAGSMFFVKFGHSPYDPIWPIDLLRVQAGEASRIFGFMLGDAQDGFPIPFYPQSLQRAHDHAALTGLDFDILQENIVDAFRRTVGGKDRVIDDLRFQMADFAERRYS